jgi:hypothetical protein
MMRSFDWASSGTWSDGVGFGQSLATYRDGLHAASSGRVTAACFTAHKTKFFAERPGAGSMLGAADLMLETSLLCAIFKQTPD